MEAFWSNGKSILAYLLKAGTMEMDGAGVRNYTELDEQRKVRRDAAIDSLLSGDTSSKLLIDIGDLLTKGFSNNLQDIESKLLEKQLQSSYDEIQHGLNDVQVKYNSFMNHYGSKAERSPGEEPDRIMITQWNSLVTCFPLLDIDWLYNWLTTDVEQKRNLMDDLADICTLEQYKKWQQGICKTFFQAYALQLGFTYYARLRGQFYSGGNSVTNAIFLAADLSAADQKDLDTMRQRSQDVVRIIKDKYQKLKTNFLLKKCGDKSHKHCGAANDEKCSELTGKVYRQLVNQKSVTNDQLAHETATSLRQAYGHFRWSVVVFRDHQYAELQLNPEHYSNIWLQRFGSEKKSPTHETVRESHVMSRGVGDFGCLLCYRVKPTLAKAAIVFWADPSALGTSAIDKEYQNLIASWNEAKHVVTNQRGNVYRVAAWLMEMDMNHIFGVGLRVKPLEEIGMALAPIVEAIPGNGGHTDTAVRANGCDGSKREPIAPCTFPLCLGNKSVCVLIWPESEIARTPLRCNVAEDNLGYIATGGGRKCDVRKVRRQGAAENEFSAVKSVPLSVSQTQAARDSDTMDIQACEISSLDNAFRQMSFLREFQHANVVRYYGCQPFLPSSRDNQLLKPTYQVFMEYCAGGSLSERVKTTVRLLEIFAWAQDTANGLAYLHGNHVSHKDIQGDHLLFQGLEPGKGPLKIVSVVRTADLVGQTQRSYITPDNRAFQPYGRDGGRVGSKTDIWSFGCVLLQMLTGAAPLLDQNGKLCTATCIPQGTPLKLEKLIKQCFREYALRPTAASIVVKLTEDRKDYDCEWTCPPRAQTVRNTARPSH